MKVRVGGNEPFVWFQDVLSRIGAHSIQQLDELLPYRWFYAARPQPGYLTLPITKGRSAAPKHMYEDMFW